MKTWTEACKDRKVLAMTTEYRDLFDPATARIYIQNVAMSFEDSNDMSTFLGLCDMAQAALVRCSVEEIQSRDEKESEITEDAVSELNMVKQKLRQLLLKNNTRLTTVPS